MTTDRLTWLAHLHQHPVIAVVRATHWLTAERMSQVAIRAGIHYIEVTTAVPDYADLIGQLRQQYPLHQIGAGTVLTPQAAALAMQAGSQFLVSPYCDPEVVRLGSEQGIPVIPGAFTPQEIWQALRAGATAVKVFPVESGGGTDYIRHLHKPLGHLPLIPTGGVTLSNTQAFLQAGAWAVGLSSDLFPQEWINSHQWDVLERRLQHFVATLESRQQPCLDRQHP
ncbi:MAG: bifunctional 4-hydroxy-2-oxoglutarate aldolase/2-dehydro-3-deoxy-phosphogluconate aldolase [Cyanobacteriota bacterium]|nr:bifunctional 4-hydroxy-2-oxoglutarate aldolase/2-dehydro-3-deoxy-phosphogluconate aldolase [Cyanobacteriota bacterium]